MSSTLKNVAYVAAGVMFAQLLGSLRSFALARLVDPDDYGIWTTAQIIVSLAPIACLGTVEALLKRVPYFRGRNDLPSLRKTEESVFGTIVLAAALLALCFLLGHNLIPLSFIGHHLAIVQITASAAAISFFTAYYYHRCTAYEDFKAVSMLDAFRSVSGLVCVLVGAWMWGVLGATVGFLASEVLNWVAFSWVCGRKHGTVRPTFQPALMADAVKVGFPITIIWWVYSIHTSVGRIAAASALGNTATGLYGAGGAVAMLFALVPNMVGRVFYPRVNAQIGADAGIEALRRSVVVPASAIALLLPIAQAVIFFTLPTVYFDFLPKYKDGLLCAQILILGAFFVSLIRNGANYLIATDMQRSLMHYVVVSVLANAAGCYVCIRLGFGVNGLAVAASLATALLASLIWRRVFIELKYDWEERASLYAGLYLPFAGTVLAIGLVHLGFSFLGVPGQWPQLQMIFVLGACAAVVMAVGSTRALMKDLFNRIYCGLPDRFRPPAVR